MAGRRRALSPDVWDRVTLQAQRAKNMVSKLAAAVDRYVAFATIIVRSAAKAFGRFSRERRVNVAKG
jgi:hypothetical protein